MVRLQMPVEIFTKLDIYKAYSRIQSSVAMGEK
jgi:hypothetical protein